MAATCKAHPKEAATQYCTRCRWGFCEECPKWSTAGGARIARCPACDGLLVGMMYAPIGVKAGARELPSGVAGFTDQIDEIVRYPFRKSVIVVLLGLAVVTSVLRWAISNNISGILAGMGLLLMLGLELWFYFHMVRATANGSEELEAPELTDLHDAILGPLLRYLAACAPILIATIWFIYSAIGHMSSDFGASMDIMDYAGPATLLLIGLLLWPLLTAIAAMGTFWDVCNPVVWFQWLGTMRSTYVMGALFFYVALFFEYVIVGRVLSEVRAEIDIPVITAVVTTTLAYMALALRARVVGAMCRPYID